MRGDIETTITSKNGVSTIDIAGEFSAISDVRNAFESFRSKFGYEYYLLLRFIDTGQNLISDQIMITNWPAAVVESYDELGLFQKSPVINALKKSTKPVFWNMKEVNATFPGSDAEIANEVFSAAGIDYGIGFTVYGTDLSVGAAVFSGKSSFEGDVDIGELSFLSNRLFKKCLNIEATGKSLNVKLSKREMECLLWTSEGKSSYEIGMILGLSEHTINNYMARVCMKLGAVNRPHLVAEAFRLGILK